VVLYSRHGGEDVKTVYTRSKALPPRVLLVGCGDAATFDAVRARKAGVRLARVAHEQKMKKVTAGGVPYAGAHVPDHSCTSIAVGRHG